jgi:(p)ppGpp synthase/HD superfamily hydrolase
MKVYSSEDSIILHIGCNVKEMTLSPAQAKDLSDMLGAASKDVFQRQEKKKDIVTLALEIATAAHAGQKREFGRDKGKPYIVHPMRVADAVHFAGPEIEAAALLHDVIEDTPLGYEDLVAKGIPKEVADMVLRLSKDPKEEYVDYILRCSGSLSTATIKFADIEDNLVTLHTGSMRDKYLMAMHMLDGKRYGRK